MNVNTIKSMSQELNGMVCYGGFFEKTAQDTAGHVAGGLGGGLLGSGISRMVMDAIQKKTPSKTLMVLGGAAALLPFVAIGADAGQRIQQESRKSRREDMIMRELLKQPRFRNRVASAAGDQGTIKVSSDQRKPGMFSRNFLSTQLK